MKKSCSLLFLALSLCILSNLVLANSLRCGGRLVDLEDTKAEVSDLCGSPDITESYCEPSIRRITDSEGKETLIESCQQIDIWSYKAESGGLWKHVYFSQGKVIEIRSGERVN